MLALHQLKVGAPKELCDERDINHSGYNKKQLVAILNKSEKETDAYVIEEYEVEFYEGFDSQEENGNSDSD